MGKQGNNVKSKRYQRHGLICIQHCLPCWKRRPPSPTFVDVAEKSADLSSPAVTRTSTTVSPPQSPHVPSPPHVTDISHISRADGHSFTGLTLVAPSPQQQSPSVWGSSTAHRTSAPQLPLSPKTPISQSQRPEKDASTVDSDPDNLDKIFDEAWKPGNGLKLADGSELPWSKGTSSPSAAARYLDDIEDGL